MDFDLRLLRHARALATEGTFARAARSLHLTQPALSRSIQLLEHRVGVALFDRGRARVEPTDMGRLFLVHAEEVLRSADSLDREVAMMRGAASGALAIGIGAYVSAMFADDALAGFVARNPGVAIRVVGNNGTDLLPRLRAGGIDVMVGLSPDDAQTVGLAITPLSVRPGRFLVRAGHPLADRDAITLDEAMRCPLAFASRMPPHVVERVIRAREGAGARGVPDFQCESVAMMRAVTLATDHAMLVLPSMFADDLRAGRLVPLRIGGPPVEQGFAVVRLEGRATPRALEMLVEAMIAADRASREAERRLEEAIDGRAPGPGARPSRRGRRARA
jgi:DNA-binding transcriptional LysR family regulator